MVELVHAGFDVGYLKFARCFHVDRRDRSVFDHEQTASTADAHVSFGEIDVDAKRLRKRSAAVGKHHDFAERIVLFRPRFHDPNVVHRQTDDQVDAFCLELGLLFDISRKVLLGACWRECTGQREHHDFLARK